MKTIFNFRISFTCFLIASLPFVFISCNDDDMSLTYFKCQLNGEEYKTPNPSLSFERQNEPVFTINVDESTTTYQFYTTIYPENKNNDNPSYFLTLRFFCEEPLKIGESYFIPKLLEEENSSLEDYVYLSIHGTNKIGYGSGSIKLVEHNDKEKWYKGTVEFEFDSPIKNEGESESIILKGEFCAFSY